MKVRYPEFVKLRLSANHAKKLLQFLPNDDDCGFDLRQQILDGLRPIYVYNVKCTDCPRIFELESHLEIPKEKISEGGICVNCMDDYK